MSRRAKVALVTGGARGLGRAIAMDLCRDHNVAITWRTTRPDGLPEPILSVQADLTEPSASAAVIAAIMERFGRLDVIVNNASSAGPSPKESVDAQALRGMWDVNVIAPSALLAAALPYLQPGAAVVNISSVNAGLPPRGAAIFGASKAALNLWTRGMAKELGSRQIRVNAVAPGAIDLPDAPRSAEQREMFVKETALGRLASPQDVARVVRFLASDDAGFVTGEVISVSGGYRL